MQHSDKAGNSASMQAFGQTRWSLVAALRNPGSACDRNPLAELSGSYRYPVYAYIRRTGARPESAWQLTQRYFDWLGGEIRAREPAFGGRFRLFLLNRLQQFLADETAAREYPAPAPACPSDELADLERRLVREHAGGQPPALAFERSFGLEVIARSAARMQHPNIVTIHEIGEHDGLPFFSMRLVAGNSLAHQLAADGPLAPAHAAAMMQIVAEAVDYAHRLGVLHLDIKPGNVLLDEHGEALVADFGLARRLEETLAGVSEEVSGTPSYMAPEQVQMGLLLAQAPVLIDQFNIEGAAPLSAELSPDGTLLALACDDYSLRWFDTATLTERGRLSVEGRPTLSGLPHLPMLLRFVDNQRLLVTLDWPSQLGSPLNLDGHLIDLKRGAFVEPPADFADLASIAYALDAHHALLFGHGGRIELWRVDPWRRLLPIIPFAGTRPAGRGSGANCAT